MITGPVNGSGSTGTGFFAEAPDRADLADVAGAGVLLTPTFDQRFAGASLPGQRDTGGQETGWAGPAAAGPGNDRQAVATLLTALFRYCERHLPQHPTLVDAVAALFTPVRCYAIGDLAQAKAQAVAVYQLLLRLRASDPALPAP